MYYIRGVVQGPRPNVVAKPCVVCNQVHRLFDCARFKALRPHERIRLVRDNKLCFNCLQEDRFSSAGTKQTTCSVAGCGQRHTKFLHVEPSTGNGNCTGTHIEALPYDATG